MVHDRRVNGETFIFGNQGGLFMNAMTWWDHKTESVWSQVWGQAIAGQLKGTTLDMIPAAIVPWGTWKAEHPQTLALDTAGLRIYGRESAGGNWVAGVAIDEYQKAFFVLDVAEQQQLINDMVGPYPVAVYADPESHNVHVYLRQVDGQTVRLELDSTGKYLVDPVSKARWDVARGLPQPGNPSESGLLLVPYISSFAWSWLDFYPNSDFFPESKRP